MTVKNTDEIDYIVEGNHLYGSDISEKKSGVANRKGKKMSRALLSAISPAKNPKKSTPSNKDEKSERKSEKAKSTDTRGNKINEVKPPDKTKKKATKGDKKQWNILTKKPMIGKARKAQSSSKPQTKERKVKTKNNDKIIERDKERKKEIVTNEQTQRKDSIAQMASLLDESQILPVEKQSGLFEEIKDSPDVHKHVGGRSVFKHRDSLHLYKDGYEPGQSVLLPKSINANRKKSRNTGFHLSLNESTMSFLGTSVGFLEMSSGLVVGQKKANPGFHISLDNISDISQSGIFIKNKIFDKYNEWDTMETTPGRKSQKANDSGEEFVDPLLLPETDQDFYEGSPITSSRRNSTRLSFLYNKHTGFICKHCFTSECHHMEKGPALDNSTPVVKQPVNGDALNQTNNASNEQPQAIESTENNEQSNFENSEEEMASKTLDDDEIQILLEILREKLNKKLNNVIELTDLAKLIKLRQVHHADDDGNMIPYNEFVLDVDNDVLKITDSMFHHSEDEILTQCDQNIDEGERGAVTSDKNNSAEKELDLSGSALRFTPVIPQDGLPPMSKKPYYRKQIPQDASKDTFYYDSDYDDASYLNGCTQSKRNGSFEKLDISNDLFYSNVELDSDVPMTPPLNASSPTHPPLESSVTKLSKRRTSLRPSSELETVFEKEEVRHFTARSSSTTHSNALTHVTTDLNVLDELIECANDRLQLKVSCNNSSIDEKENYNTGLEQYTDPLDSFKLPDTASIENNARKSRPQTEKVSYSDLSCSELKALAKKQRTLKSLALEEEATYDSTKSIKVVRDDIINSMPGLDILQNNEGFYENNQLELWLQDVRNQCLDHMTEQEGKELDEQGMLDEENNKDCQDGPFKKAERNINETTQQPLDQVLNLVSSDTNTNSELSNNLNAVDEFYHHIDVLVLDGGSRDDQNAAMSPNPSTITTTRDSGVESHRTDTSHTLAGDNPLETRPGNNDQETVESFQQDDHSHLLAQRLNFTHDIAWDYRNARINALKPPTIIHEPKPPTKEKHASKVFTRNHSAKKTKLIDSGLALSDVNDDKIPRIPRPAPVPRLPRVNSRINNDRNYIHHEEELLDPYHSYPDHLPYLVPHRRYDQQPYDLTYFPPRPNMTPLRSRMHSNERHNNHFYLTQPRRTLRENNYRTYERLERVGSMKKRFPPYNVHQRNNLYF